MSERLYAPHDVESVLAQLLPRLDNLDISFAFLHGSALQGIPYHDLDIAVFVRPGTLSGIDPLQWMLQLGDELERRAHRPVDLHLLNHAPPGFSYMVSRGRLLFCHDEQLLADWRERTWNEYLDMEPYLREQLRTYLGRPA